MKTLSRNVGNQSKRRNIPEHFELQDIFCGQKNKTALGIVFVSHPCIYYVCLFHSN
jgi:hypothetical protein